MSSKAERTDLARIEASAAALLALSRERAATTATLESNLGATAAETTALRERAADHDQALVTLKTGLAQRREACRDTFEQRARGLEKRVRRAEEGLAMVMAEIGARMAEVTRRCRWGWSTWEAAGYAATLRVAVMSLFVFRVFLLRMHLSFLNVLFIVVVFSRSASLFVCYIC